MMRLLKSFASRRVANGVATSCAITGCAVLAACSAPESRKTPGPDAVAIFDGGEISFAEVDAVILALPAPERATFGAQDPEAPKRLVRELALDRLLFAEAEAHGLAQDPAVLRDRQALERQALVGQRLLERLPPLERPTEEELRQTYAAKAEAFRTPERRSVLHIFRRLEPDANAAPLVEELRQARQRVIEGSESFPILASELSDSESRHQQGLLGWFEPGDLAPDLDRLVFSLEEEVPSEPIITRDGVHLFLVDTVLPAQSMAFEQALPGLQEGLLKERNERALVEIEASLGPPQEGDFWPGPKQLRERLRAPHGASMIRIGDFEITVGEFLSQLARERQQAALGEAQLTARALGDRIRRRERFYRAFRDDGPPLHEETRQALDKQIRQLMIDRLAEQLVDERIERSRIEDFYRNHRKRFVQPVQWRLRRLSIPLSKTVSRMMAELEQRHASGLNRNLEDLQSSYGGQIETLDWLNMAELKQLDDKLAFHASALREGQISPPYRTQEAIELIEAVGHRQGEPLPYDKVEAQVRASYIKLHGQPIYEALVDERLQAHGFELLEERLMGWLRSPGTAPLPERPSTPET